MNSDVLVVMGGRWQDACGFWFLSEGRVVVREWLVSCFFIVVVLLLHFFPKLYLNWSEEFYSLWKKAWGRFKKENVGLGIWG